MPIWCPECNAMLAEGTEECPRCGAHLENSDPDEGFSRSDIAWFSAYTIAIIVIPIIIGVGIGVLCLLLFNSRS
jgi:uncharacterized paraquat-inducible protein A